MNATTETLVLTEDQQIVVQKIRDFLKGPERMFLLTGKAGTGKTTVIRYALEELLVCDLHISKTTSIPQLFSVIGITVAHKAKENLRASIPYVNTFASVFGQRESWDEEGNQVFKPNKKAMETSDCKIKWKVAVIDECSMFNKSMLRTVFDNLDKRTKVIFMGDRGQLPPIEEDSGARQINLDSPVFELDLPSRCNHQLTKRVRQTEGNPIIDLSDIIYGEIFGGCDLHKVRKELSCVCLDSDGYGFQPIDPQLMYPTFRDISQNGYLDTKMLAYRRVTVDDYNRFLRGYIYQNPEQEYIPGEILYMNKNYFFDDGFHRWKAYNSNEYLVKRVRDGEVDGIPVYRVYIESEKFIPVLQGPSGSISMELYYHRLGQFKKAKAWEAYWAFSDMFADISYGYTLTAYKAQGSTYRNIFVDVKDIYAVRPITPKRKLQALYTSITRASNNVFFIV